MQRAGGRYRAANGARLPNLGQLLAAFDWSEWEVQDFTQCGVEWHQDPATYAIELGQKKYLRESVSEIPFTAERAKAAYREAETRRLRTMGRLEDAKRATHCSRRASQPRPSRRSSWPARGSATPETAARTRRRSP